MNKLLLTLACTSSVVSTGCISLIAAGAGSVSKSNKAKKDETARFDKLVATYGELKHDNATASGDIAKLEKAHGDWMQLYRNIQHYRGEKYFGDKKIGSCNDGRKSDHCKQAVSLQAKVAHEVANNLHAAIDATPDVTMPFPLMPIVFMQEHDDIAAALDVEASLTRLVPRWNQEIAKVIKTAGGAETLARKEATGMCFMSDAPQGDKIKPRFAFSRSVDELFIRCVAPKSIDSYDRSEKDIVTVDLMTLPGKPLRVTKLPGDAHERSQSHGSEMSMGEVRRLMKNAEGKLPRFALVDVRYLARKKVGTRAYDNGNGVSLEDEIQTTIVASGYAVLDLEADLGGDTATRESGDDSDEADDVPAPKAKAKGAKKTKKAKTATKSKKTRSARHSRRSTSRSR